ncbi:MAG TPA: ComF family protein [Vicinamibacterales bacterium]|nr:ComF family protein [Vicinamibacterales bacterium]
MLLAPACAACRSPLEQPLGSPVCIACWRSVRSLAPPICVRCGDALASWRAPGPSCARCRRRPPDIDLARSAGRYEGALREILHVFKYEKRRPLSAPLGRLMRAAGREVLAGADAVVPVPLHPRRALSRGFNQADDLARELGLPVWRVLRRIRHGPPQAGLPAGQRAGNVRDAFALRTLAGIRRTRSLLRNRRVVLVDDVMTTGATLEACSRVLRLGGVRSVRALTVARAVAAPPERPPPRPRPWTARRR